MQTLLLAFGVSNFIGLTLHLPNMESFLVDSEYCKNFLIGSCMFGVSGWLAGGQSTPQPAEETKTPEAGVTESEKKDK